MEHHQHTTAAPFTVRLTPREKLVIQGVVEGKRNKEIAFLIGVRENTVKIYLSRIFEKLHVDGRHALAVWARAYSEYHLRIAEAYQRLHPEQQSSQLAPQPVFRDPQNVQWDVIVSMTRSTPLTLAQIKLLMTLLQNRAAEIRERQENSSK